MGHAILHVWGYPGPSGCMLTISSHLSEPMLSADGGAERIGSTDGYSVRSPSVRPPAIAATGSESMQRAAVPRTLGYPRLP